MIQILDTRHDLTCYAITSSHDLPRPALLGLLDDAWQADYRDQMRIALDERFLHRLLADPSVWVACLICNDAGQLLGFELALQRILYWHGQPFTAYYTRLLTIHHRYRRHGYGRWLLHCFNHLLFEGQGADLVFAAFHVGHAGLPTVQQTYTSLPGSRLHCFYTAPVWGCRLDRLPADSLATTVYTTRIVAQTETLTGLERLAQAAPDLIPVPPLAQVRTALQHQYAVSFGLEDSFCTQYLQRETTDAGTYWYHFGDTSYCIISYDIVTLLCNAQYLGCLGRIQAVHTAHCTPTQLQQSLHHICQVFIRQGCLFAGLLDLSVFPPSVLRALAFHPLGDASVFAVRGPQTVIEALAPVQAPFFLDF